LIPDLHALPEQQPRAQALALRRRGIEIPVVDTAPEAAGDKERVGEREQWPPGTPAPGESDIAIVGRTRRVDREPQVRTWRPQHDRPPNEPPTAHRRHRCTRQEQALICTLLPPWEPPSRARTPHGQCLLLLPNPTHRSHLHTGVAGVMNIMPSMT